MRNQLLENYRYYLNDNMHFFVVKRDQRDDGVKKVVEYYKGNTYIANEHLENQSIETLRERLEQRKLPIGA